jgi:bla regulator protein BlaR1
VQTLAISVAIATLAFAQTTKAPEFEVASIRPAIQDDHHSSNSDQGRFTTHNLTLKDLISLAYDVDAEFVSGGPNWADSDSFDINAKIPEELVLHMTVETEQQMIQSLLASRFRLALHRETRQVDGYDLTVVKKGPKMEISASGDENSHINTNNTHLTAKNVTMEGFAKYLSSSRDVGKLVVDKTGLAGRYNFTLDWAPERVTDAHTDDRPSIFTALQEQLGLRLSPAKVPIQAVAIDRAEKPGSN